MPGRAACYFALLLSLLFTGCGGGGLAINGDPADCKLDLKQLDGQWLSLKGGEGGKDLPDKHARIKFFQEDGKRKAIYTAGQIAPDIPTTNKYVYDFVEVTSQGDAFYRINLIKGKSKQRIERLKKDNRRLDLKFEGRLYIKIDAKQCVLRIGDMYATWVKGEKYEDTNPTGWRTYIPTKELWHFTDCSEDLGALVAYPGAEIGEDDKPLNPKEGLFAEEPSHFHYSMVNMRKHEYSEEEQLKKGMKAQDGCSYDYEIWMRDKEVLDAHATKVEPAEDGSIDWYYAHTFKKSSAIGIFVEMDRYKTCDGKREFISNACTLVWPNRPREEGGEEKDGEKK